MSSEGSVTSEKSPLLLHSAAISEEGHTLRRDGNDDELCLLLARNGGHLKILLGLVQGSHYGAHRTNSLRVLDLHIVCVSIGDG